MKRIVLGIPVGLTFADLSPDQQQALGGDGFQCKCPMTGTIERDGYFLADCLTSDEVDHESFATLGMDWPIVVVCTWSGSGVLHEVVPVDGDLLLSFLAPVTIFDDEGQVVETRDPVLHEPSRWSGWPPLF